MISHSDDSFDLKSFLKNLTTHSGVYRMIDANGEIIYVGKAKNLKNRVNSYFSKGAKDNKTLLMASQVEKIEITITPSDYEAYLLENNLIKQHRPKYNILFKDDKSYPYLVISRDKFPRIAFYRGKSAYKKGQCFGPFVSISSVKFTLNIIQKIFPIRQCENSYYNSRIRPCLQYQIKRCLAPCVGLVSEEQYNEQLAILKKFLAGKFSSVLEDISQKMHDASENMEYEKAQVYRDQLVVLRKLQQQQIVDIQADKTFDVIAIHLQDNYASIALLQIQNGDVVADRHWSIDAKGQDKTSVMHAFLSHFYLGDEARNIWPKNIILSKVDFAEITELMKSISKRIGHAVNWILTPAVDNLKWLKLAEVNARQKLNIYTSSKSQYQKRLDSLREFLHLDKDIKRIECFDISHFQGEATIASCVVYTDEGEDRKSHRRYNIKDVKAGDDYAAIAQAVSRRVSSGIEADNLPDIMIIDGGKGQIHQAEAVLEQLGVKDKIQLVSLGKGVERISGKEKIYKGFDDTEYTLDEHDAGFLLLRQVRDSAHDHAIKGQRKKVSSNRQSSIIEEIEGVGPKRRKALIMHFGGWQELSSAGVDEIAKVKGISKKLAQEIWECFH
ncbi:excinuclease ABC subunit UvrC [Francisella adeliensis]|uniref:UvrABC system protein C n=1 Tax=Francisella adeliensis TaxID=2007306 RepID=A0A2Z4XXG2_9GAMM|nr:excinuclease ABC subunit UvrC [Francisella adeliensis]AXA33449.1 excinuclease ABC subunit C [Francisella adeliensis]MBK2085469.1 excinuclease ABC subunit UvrC [Francisella adeliensis]MBK2097199.1 excinuclease ABC subunit UvrC [Francisella adeliensis]QIW11677.1 excinuclease ABC subunit UvrC [Francisella adeliensis]QIW13552.1 excinuclease ABC subunit UvrC [Francisella adeliensis]